MPTGDKGTAGRGWQAARAERSRPLVDDLAPWLHHKRAGLSGRSDTAKAMDCLLKRWPAFTIRLRIGAIVKRRRAGKAAYAKRKG